MGIDWHLELVVLARTHIYVTRDIDDEGRIVEHTELFFTPSCSYTGSRVVSLDGEPFDAEIAVIGPSDIDDAYDVGLGYVTDDGEEVHIGRVEVSIARERRTGRYVLIADSEVTLSDRAVSILLASVMPMPTIVTEVIDTDSRLLSDHKRVLGPPDWVDDDNRARWLAATQAALERGAAAVVA